MSLSGIRHEPDGETWIEVSGESMTPFLLPGDRVRITPRSSKIAPGAIALARPRKGGESWVIHRIIEEDRSAGSYVLHGDAGIMSDRVDAEMIWGTLSAISLGGSTRPASYAPGRVDRWIAALIRHGRNAPFPLGGALRRLAWVLGHSRRRSVRQQRNPAS